MGVIGRFFHGIENDTLIFGKGDATKEYINTCLPSNSNESYEYVSKPKTKSLEWSWDQKSWSRTFWASFTLLIYFLAKELLLHSLKRLVTNCCCLLMLLLTLFVSHGVVQGRELAKMRFLNFHIFKSKAVIRRSASSPPVLLTFIPTSHFELLGVVLHK